ncbi:hypothetical protein LCGC14_2225460 [marine sediment metagenome]|uniref:Uncharacterized protein n=1 Tax=marine sediment metagenome TaxID=412755 RepID=A0A0F9D9U4_9ZZZZ
MPRHTPSERRKNAGKSQKKKGLKKALNAPNTKAAAKMATRKRVLTDLLGK